MCERKMNQNLKRQNFWYSSVSIETKFTSYHLKVDQKRLGRTIRVIGRGLKSNTV